MQALIVIDAQNEFSAAGRRPVANHEPALAAIHRRIDEARREGRPIAFLRHLNKAHESAAFQPGSWGAEFSPGIGPRLDRPGEAEFVKDVFGAFTGTDLGGWLEQVGCDEVLLVGPAVSGLNFSDHDERGRINSSSPSIVKTTCGGLGRPL